MARADVRYICQRAANAIISEIGPYRVSTDALQAINLFLDEFLVLLLTSAASLDLARMKTVILNLLPSTLGKNAIVEAELEVKTFTETETVNYEIYERMRLLGQSEPFPKDTVLSCLRDRCFEFCTLADKEDQQQWMALKAKHPKDIVVSPMVAIYVTTVLEHMAEYILTGVVIAAEQEDTEYIRIKEVFLALIDDIQVGDVFYRMNMREKMEKRAIAYGYRPKNTVAHSRTSSPTPRKQSYLRDSIVESINGSFMDINFDDMDLGYEEDTKVSDHRSSVIPQSVISQSASSNTVSSNSSHSSQKKAFKVFKMDDASPDSAPNVCDLESPAMSFEELIRSGSTMRVSLTPNRLRSIEVKEKAEKVKEPPVWERRSVTLLRTPSAKDVPSSPSIYDAVPKSPFTSSTLPLISGAKARPSLSLTSGLPLPPLSSVSTPTMKTSPTILTLFPPSLPPLTPPPPPPPLPPPQQPVPDLPSLSPLLRALPDPPQTHLDIRNELPKPPVLTIAPMSPSHRPILKQSQSLEKIPEDPKREEPQPTLRRGSMSSRKSRENLRRLREKDEARSNLQQDTTAPLTPAEEKAPEVVVSMPVPITTLEIKRSSRKMSLKKSKSHKSTPDMTIHREPAEPISGHSHGHTSSSHTGSGSGSSSSDTMPTFMPERPSLHVAKRASIHASRQSSTYDESMDRSPVRPSTAGSVGMSIKAWDEISKLQPQEEEEEKARPAVVVRQNKSSSEEENDRAPHRKVESAVLDKVLKFEQVNSVDDYRASYVSRRERFLYLQRDPIALERKPMSMSLSVRPVRGIDMATQTETATPLLLLTANDDQEEETMSISLDRTDLESVSERGMVDGDEEWFLQDDEWEDVQDQESAVVEWLLGEA
ncbi:hypothetical protein BDF14DRAFT_605497 [Spinellus fusiger]|nr:hypothetical protein BDF14DRAFT_605497 [Spinellus fusiger]